MSLSAGERRIVDEIERRADELIELASDLVRFDTTAREPGAPARDEAALQDYLAARLREAGARVDIWEPSPADVAGARLTPPDPDFAADRSSRLASPAAAAVGASS